jgi:D-tyrosyl-tRNA(Tyr) deacylase
VKCVIQRVRFASVTVDDELISKIGPGLLVLAAVEKGDSDSVMNTAARKIVEMRIFADEQGKMNRSVTEIQGEILAVSQFTLAASLEKGRRPSFVNAEDPELAREKFSQFVEEMRKLGVPVQTGRFREHMIVALENDGPVTFYYQSS